MGTHEGGYDPFSYDITDAIKEGSEQTLIVTVWDPTDAGTQPRGKQVNKPGGIFYTPVTGIWQTVWIEPVPKAYIAGLTIVPDLDNKRVSVTTDAAGDTAGVTVRLSADSASAGDNASTLRKNNRDEAGNGGAPGAAQTLTVPVMKWSPDEPWLYDLKVELVRDGKVIDSVGSYFALRKIEVAQDAEGVNPADAQRAAGVPVRAARPRLVAGMVCILPPPTRRSNMNIEVTKKLGYNMCPQTC